MRSSFAALLIALPAVALAAPPNIQVEHAWSRATPAGTTGVVYLTITDQGDPDKLTAVSSSVATKSELHESFDDHGIMKMRAVANLLVTTARPLTLAPGGYHIMLMGLKQPLVAGTTFPLTLTFAGAGDITTTVSVRTTIPTKMDHGHGGTEGMKSH